jgi:dihydrofolate reductase
MTHKLSLICAMARNHVIGIKNDLPWHIPQDLEHFKNLTKGKPIIMGRLTYDSILARRNGKPLPHRPHYVVSRRDLGVLPDVVKTFTELQKAIDQAKVDYPDSEIMIIGGASIYEQSVSLVDRMYLTIIDTDIEGDAFFPQWKEADWVETQSEAFSEPLDFKFITLDRGNK